jgi:Ni,Fe-hydrogenase maturation factor
LSAVASRAGRLVIGIGNPSRGDDAVGPLAVERLDALNLPDVEFLTDFQLQVEYLLDVEGREEVIFIDATRGADEPGSGPGDSGPSSGGQGMTSRKPGFRR